MLLSQMKITVCTLISDWGGEGEFSIGRKLIYNFIPERKRLCIGKGLNKFVWPIMNMENGLILPSIKMRFLRIK